ncbi:hypothetical protein EVAR_81827_1 [Eumeta japonica]|uniref:Uncharacterized protein n=1 Tax=Eumeta variegata TaxID=151549 RepID=A0A4C1XSN3_EUMVA|nr:hypothetical protein EVAR_81827_1 [Eumeta japonica]
MKLCRSELPANDAMLRLNPPRPILLLPGVPILCCCDAFVTNFAKNGRGNFRVSDANSSQRINFADSRYSYGGDIARDTAISVKPGGEGRETFRPDSCEREKNNLAIVSHKSGQVLNLVGPLLGGATSLQ